MKKVLLGLAIVLSLLLITYFIFHKQISENANKAGIELYNTEQYSDAAKSFRKAYKYDKGNFDAQLNLVRTLLVLKEYTDSEELLLKMAELFPENAEGIALKGQLLTLQEKFEEALLFLNRAIELQDDLAFAYYYRGIVKANLNDLDGAAADYKKAQEIDQSNIDALEQRATILSQLMDYEEAIKNYNRLIEADPSNTNAFINRGNFKMEINDYSGAVEDFTAALELDDQLSDVYFNRGKSFAKNEDYDMAIPDFKMAIKLDYKIAGANFNIGLAYLKLNQPGEAEKYLKNCIKYDKKSEHTAKAYYMLGVMQLMQNKNQAAVDYFNSSIKTDAANADTYFNRSIAYGILKKPQLALDDLNTCIKLGMKTSDVYFALGVNKISLNNFGAGCADLKVAKEMGHERAEQMRNQYCKNHQD